MTSDTNHLDPRLRVLLRILSQLERSGLGFALKQPLDAESNIDLAFSQPPPLAIEPIGFYAYRIVWSDGHDSGLFTLEHLRELGSH